MAEERTLARPYAEAVFELARTRERLAEWSEALNTLATIVANADVASLIGNPRVDDAELAGAIIAIGGDAVDENGRNLVRLLTENGRLGLLPAIAELYAELRAAAENRVDVAVTAASEISEEQQQQLVKALEARLDRNVSVSYETDPALIGGALIRAGDLVIDGTVRADLARLTQTLTH